MNETIENESSRMAAQTGILLRVGMYSSASVILLGGVLFLARHGTEHIDYSHFHGEPQQLMSLRGIPLQLHPLIAMKPR